jgi:hypothetical protein
MIPSYEFKDDLSKIIPQGGILSRLTHVVMSREGLRYFRRRSIFPKPHMGFIG